MTTPEATPVGEKVAVFHGPFAEAFDLWAEGTRYTHEHFWADPSKFVGHVPAAQHRAAEVAVLEGVPELMAELERLRLAVDANSREVSRFRRKAHLIKQGRKDIRL